MTSPDDRAALTDERKAAIAASVAQKYGDACRAAVELAFAAASQPQPVTCAALTEIPQDVLDALLDALCPLAKLGGPGDMQAFHDLEDNVVIFENSGSCIDAGDVRHARELIAKITGKPVSMMHGRERSYPSQPQPVNRADPVDVAIALEQQRALHIVQAVRTQGFAKSDTALPTQAESVFDLACEEIEHRLRAEVWELGGVAAPVSHADDDLEQAFQLVFEAYNKPRDQFSEDNGYIVFLRGKVTKAFSLLQKIRRSRADGDAVPVAWQYRYRCAPEWSVWYACKESDVDVDRPNHEYRALYAAPHASTSAEAVPAKPIGYVTSYALETVLAHGGHIPMHPEPLCLATVPVYLAAPIASALPVQVGSGEKEAFASWFKTSGFWNDAITWKAWQARALLAAPIASALPAPSRWKAWKAGVEGQYWVEHDLIGQALVGKEGESLAAYMLASLAHEAIEAGRSPALPAAQPGEPK